MLVTLIAVLCLNGECRDVVVTDQARGCGADVLQSLPHWMDEQGYLARGFRLAGWKCQIGKRERA